MATTFRRVTYMALVWLGVATIPAGAGAQHTPVPLSEMSHTAWTYADSIMVGGSTRVVPSSDGYLWLGSPRGLIRFDGVRFTLIDSAHAPALATPRAGIFAPRLRDSRGTLWITRPDNGIVTYREGRFRVVVDSIPARDIDVLEESDGRILLWSRGQSWVRTLDEKTGRLDPVSLPPIGDAVIAGLVRDTADGLWLGTQPPALWHRTAGRWISVEPPAGPQPYPPVRPFLHARDGTLWATQQGALYYRSNGRWARLEARDKPGVPIQTTYVAEALDGSIWIATTNAGIVRRSPDGTLENFQTSQGLSGANSWSIYVNDFGVAWVTTGAGLDRLRIVPLSAIPDHPRFPMTSIEKIVRDSAGFAWAQSDAGRGIARFDGWPVRNTRQPFVADSVRLPGTPESGYHVLEAARGGGLWVSPYGGGIARVNHGTVDRLGDRAGVPRERFWQVLEARDGSLWTATLFEGLGRVRDGRYSAISLFGVAKPAVASLVEDARGRVWISLDRRPGIVAMQGDRVVHQLDSAAGVRDTVLRLMVEGGDTLWGVGTRSLVRVTGQQAVTVPLPSVTRLRGVVRNRRTGIPSLGSFIARGRLWIAGEGGIGHYSLARLHAAADGRATDVEPVVLDPLDGAAVPATRSLTLDPVSPIGDGRFWVRTAAGVAILDPTRLIVDDREARPLVEEIRVAGKRVPFDRAIEIGPNPERVEIRVTATSATFPERIRLEHRLDGAETVWNRTGPSRTVTYTQLRPGTYTFRLRVPNDTSVGAPHEASLAFRVVPAWYQAYWFLGLATLIVAAGGPVTVYGWLRHRGRAREAQLRARYDAALEERTRVARELHDTLLQGFSGIALQLQRVLLTLEKSPQQAAERLSRTLGIADATLLDARRMIWDMRAPELEHNDLPAALEGAVLTAVADTPITVRFRTHGRSRRLAPLVESTMLRIGREATANAVRHANASAIDIELVYADEHVDLSVRDDGRGFATADVDAAPEHGHWGVSGMRERAASVGGAFDIRGSRGEGTVVSVRLPVDVARSRRSRGQSTRSRGQST